MAAAAGSFGSEALEHTLLELERRGGGAFASSSTRIGLSVSLSGSRPNGSVISATVSYSGSTLTDGTPLRMRPDGRLLLDVDGRPTPEPPGFDPLKEAGVRDELVRRGWKADRAGLRKEWLVRGGADRLSLRDEIKEVLATLGPNENLSLTYLAPGADAGFAQVGCVVIFASAIVAGLIGVVMVFIAGGIFDPAAGVVGFLAGWLAGMFVTSQGVWLAVRTPRLRPNAENVAILVGICAAGILTVIVTVLIGLVYAPGRGIG